jgi:hypothetical protein
MTYRPERRIAFGPPIRDRLPALAWFAIALTVTAVIIYGQNAPSNSRLFQFVVEGDRHRLVSSSICAIMLFVSGLAAVLRDQMRGVIVHPEGLVLREQLGFGLPRVRRFAWSQIDRVSVPSAESREAAVKQGKTKGIRIDLWDGSRTWLPEVGNVMGLAVVLERVALARAIPIEGGTGLLDDLGSPLEDDA